LLILSVFQYLKSRLSKADVTLTNFVNLSHHHQIGSIEPSVSVIVPTRDKPELLRQCIDSIIAETSYKNYSILVVNNQSVEPKTHKYFIELENAGISILDFPYEFNYAEICNVAASSTSGDYLCFLNNDTVVVESEWLTKLVAHAVTPGVGVVGSKLLFADGTIQHIGVALGHKGIGSHPFAGQDQSVVSSSLPGDCFEVSAVTFACALTPRSVFSALGGLDPKFKVGLNDLDYCLRLSRVGLCSVACGQSCLIHLESQSRNRMLSLHGFRQASIEILTFLKKHQFPQGDKYFS
jgi:GT2 family glycosyltransferase